MKTITAVLCLALLLATPATAFEQRRGPAQNRGAAPADRAKVADTYGKSEKRVSRNPDKWAALAVDDLLPPDSAVRTAEHAGILLVLPDRHNIRIGEKTDLELKEVGQNNSYYFQLIEGEIWSFVNKARKPTKYEVETTSTVLGVSGTLFNISHNRSTNESDMSVADGVVSLRQGSTTQNVAPGYSMRVRKDQLAKTQPEKQDRSQLQMWRVMRTKETWTHPVAGTPKLAQDTEADVRTLKQAHEKQVQQQEKAAQAKAAKAKAPKAGKKAGPDL